MKVSRAIHNRILEYVKFHQISKDKNDYNILVNPFSRYYGYLDALEELNYITEEERIKYLRFEFDKIDLV